VEVNCNERWVAGVRKSDTLRNLKAGRRRQTKSLVLQGIFKYCRRNEGHNGRRAVSGYSPPKNVSKEVEGRTHVEKGDVICSKSNFSLDKGVELVGKGAATVKARIRDVSRFLRATGHLPLHVKQEWGYLKKKNVPTKRKKKAGDTVDRKHRNGHNTLLTVAGKLKTAHDDCTYFSQKKRKKQ